MSTCWTCLGQAEFGDTDENRQRLLCDSCGLRVHACSCEVVDLVGAQHPVYDGVPLMVGDGVRVKGREGATWGGVTGGVVTEIRLLPPRRAHLTFPALAAQVWIAVGDNSEIFREDDLEVISRRSRLRAAS